MFAITVFLVYQVFFVQFSYDDNTIYYRSLLAGEKHQPWTNLEYIGYSDLLGSGYLKVHGIGLVWCSSMLDGYGELVEFLDQLEPR